MARHRSKTPAGAAVRIDIHAAVREATAELERRKAYELLKHLERRITDFRPCPTLHRMPRLSQVSPSVKATFISLSTGRSQSRNMNVP
jgi:hypothetical protein